MNSLRSFYIALIIAGLIASATATLLLYDRGSGSVPGWRAAFQPGRLSTGHAFLEGKCETCHTPSRGVEAVACIRCHSSAATELAKQPTAFHATIQDCRGCHSEHEAADRPTRMDHASLVRIGSHLAEGVAGHPGVSRQMINDMADFLGISASAAAEKDALDCASCHSNQDPHQELLGRDCAGCHETATWRIASHLHPSPTAKDCAQCHQAPESHYGEHFISMGGAGHGVAQVSQCYQCHKTNSFRDRKDAGFSRMH